MAKEPRLFIMGEACPDCGGCEYYCAECSLLVELEAVAEVARVYEQAVRARAVGLVQTMLLGDLKDALDVLHEARMQVLSEDQKTSEGSDESK